MKSNVGIRPLTPAHKNVNLTHCSNQNSVPLSCLRCCVNCPMIREQRDEIRGDRQMDTNI